MKQLLVAIAVLWALTGSATAGDLGTLSIQTPEQIAALAPVGVGPAVEVPPLRNPIIPDCPQAPVDASACLQAAINAGDVQIPTGSYIVHGVHVPGDRRIAGATNLVTLKNPLTAGSRGHTDSTLILNHATNSVISNLTFAGSNDPITPNANSVYSAEFVFEISVDNGSNNNIIANNRFQAVPGDAAIELYGANVGQCDQNNQIVHNSFVSSASYGVALVCAVDNEIHANWFKDSSVGAEMDAPSWAGVQANYGNKITGNVIENVNGQPNFLFGATGRHHPFVTGGAAFHGVHYGNTVADNHFIGPVDTIPMK